MHIGPFHGSLAGPLIVQNAFSAASRGFVLASLLFFAASSNAAVIQFEGFAPAGSVVNVNPAAPYSESGFTFTPINANSAVFDAAAASRLLGDPTSWFGFAADNQITLTGPTPFNLNSLQIGPSTIGIGVINATLMGDVLGGGTLSATFSGLTAATLVTLNWTNLRDVTLSVSSDAGIDNITATGVPEPGTLLLLAAGFGMLTLRRWRFRNVV